MPWQHIRIARFGGPEVLELAEEQTVPAPGPGEVRIKVLLAAGQASPIPSSVAADIRTSKGHCRSRQAMTLSASSSRARRDRAARRPVDRRSLRRWRLRTLCDPPLRASWFRSRMGSIPPEAVCIPLAYLTAFQMLTRYRLASGTVGTALLDLARHSGLEAIGTCSAANAPTVEHFGAVAIDYRAGDFVAAVRRITSGRKGRATSVDAAFDAIGGAHFSRSFASLAKGGLLVGYGSQAMAGWA